MKSFSATYTYDGNRVEKSNGKLYWYGAGTEILDESDASGNFTNEYVFFGGKRVAHRTSSNVIYYYEADMLGSARSILQAGQTTVCYDADFLPFGGERVVTNTCSQNYKFEGKKRDLETGNDDFGARYYRANIGRWMSADWSSVPAPVPYANLTNPQTLNLYAMVSDNPETFADLDGHKGIAAPSMNQDCMYHACSESEALYGGDRGTAGSGIASMLAALVESSAETNQEKHPAPPPQNPQDAQAQQQLEGPYVADLKSKEIAPLLDPNHKPSTSDVVGSGQCVDLTKKFSGMGKEDIGTYRWRPGPKVVGNKDIKPGTAIATFNDRGRYPSAHRWNSGIYLNKGVNGSIWILDQWPGHPPEVREVFLNSSRAPADNSAAYSVVYVVPR